MWVTDIERQIRQKSSSSLQQAMIEAPPSFAMMQRFPERSLGKRLTNVDFDLLGTRLEPGSIMQVKLALS